MFPDTLVKRFMTRHFWTSEQKVKFGEERLRRRLVYYPKIMSLLNKETRKISDEQLQAEFERILDEVS